MKNAWIGLMLCAAGCGREPEPPRREWNAFHGTDLDPADPTLGVVMNWVWEDSTGEPLYAVAAAATSLSMSLKPNDTPSGRAYVIVRGTKVDPPPADGFLHFFDKSGAWIRTEIRVETLRGWNAASPRREDPFLKEHLLPLMRKHRLDR